MKRSLGLVALAAVAATLAALASAAGAASKEPIVFGFATAETSFISAFDKPAVIGARMAIEDLNKKGGILGRPIKIVHADTKSDIAQGSRAGAEVISKGANAMLVTPDFNFGAGAAREAQKAGIVVISMGAGSPKFGVQGIGNLAYTMGVAATTDGAVAAEWGYQSKKLRNAYELIDDTTDYDKEQCKAFEGRWKQLGGKILGTDTFKNGDPSIATQVTRIKGLSTKPDFIMLCSYPSGGAVAVKQLRDAGINAAIISNGAMDGTYWYEKSMPKLSDFYYTASASVFGNDPSPRVNDFDRRYRQRTGKFPDNYFPVLGYVAVQAIAYGMEKAGTTDGKAVAAQLDKFRNQDFLGLKITFSPTQHIDSQRQERIMEVQGGKHSVAALWVAKKQPPLFG